MSKRESRNERIKRALSEAKVSQEKLANALGVTDAAVNGRLNSDKDIDSVAFIEAVSGLTGRSKNWLIYGLEPSEYSNLDKVFLGHKSNMKRFYASEASEKYLAGQEIRTIPIMVDATGRELMTFVPVKAQAGYMKGYGDPHFIETLPAFNLPTFTEGSYRMFQVDGNSMLQLGGGGLHDGDIVIAQYLEDFFSIRDNRVYVVVCAEGVVVKRCLNRLKTDDQSLILKSDNKNGDYPDMVLHASEIREVWELKAFISRQLSFATDLWDVISELQAQQAIMKEKLKEIGHETPEPKETRKSIKRAR